MNRGLDINAIVEEASNTTIKKLYGWWDWVVRNLGAIMGLAILWDLCVMIVTLIINVYSLYCEYGISWLLLDGLWSTLAKHTLYENMFNKMKRRLKEHKETSSKRSSTAPNEEDLLNEIRASQPLNPLRNDNTTNDHLGEMSTFHQYPPTMGWAKRAAK